MRVALVGGGYWGSKHLRVLASMRDVHDLILVDLDEARRDDLAASYPSITCVASLDEALDRVDAVVIATPASTHARLGLQALRANKHLLVEKPLALSTAASDSMVQEARQRSLTLMVGHTFVFNPAVIGLKKRIDAGELGDIQFIRAQRLNLGLHQRDVNVIWDLAPHDISILNYLLGESPSSVTAWGHSAAGMGSEDIASLRLTYEQSGIEAHVELSWLDPVKVREVTVVGTKKMAIFDDLKSEESLRVFDKGLSHATSEGHGLPLSYRFGTITSPFIEADEPLAREVLSFIRAAQTGGPTDADGEAGRAVVAVLEAAERSLASGKAEKPVEVDVAESAAIRLH